MKNDNETKQVVIYDTDTLKKRLNVIEGQVRGIKQMLDDERECNDILIQISAVSKSLNKVGEKILKNYLYKSIVNDIKNDKIEVIEDVVDLFKKLD